VGRETGVLDGRASDLAGGETGADGHGIDLEGGVPDAKVSPPDQKIAPDQTPPTNAYYVSPSGNDSDPGTFAQPCKTLQAARSAMQGSSIKTTYLMGGVYPVSATLALGSNDAGESWLGYPGQTPVLDGGNAVNVVIRVDADDVTIRWLTVKNSTETGIFVQNAKNVTIDSNTITDINSTAWNQACIRVLGCSDSQISHNLVDTCHYVGIGVWHNADGNNNVVVDSNVVKNTCLSVADCGAIYAWNPKHSATGTQITNNIVGSYGNSTTGGRGIYLDDQLSNVTVTGNIVYGTGQWSLQIHGGDHNTLQNNIFDISAATQFGLYQDVVGGPHYGMTGNVFTCNIVWTSVTKTGAIWDYINESGATMALPSVSNNAYWSTSGTQLSNTGTITDSSPVVSNPNVVNPEQHVYDFQSSPPLGCFTPIDTSKIGPVPH